MNKKEIKNFFDKCATTWDDYLIKDDIIINKILNNANVYKDSDVLDVASGTGVLFDYYKERDVNVVGIDISSKMVEIAKEKHPDINVICGDIEDVVFDKTFDVVMVYNAFPHFSDPKALISTLSRLVKQGGVLSIAHSMSKDMLRCHHRNARDVSIELLDEYELAHLLKESFIVKDVIANDEMYQVTGIKV